MWPVPPRNETRPAVRRRVRGAWLGRPLAWAGVVALGLLAAGPVAAHGDVPDQAPDLGILFTAWSFDPTVAIPLLATALAWLWAIRRIDRRHPGNPVAPLRVASFLVGLAFIALALQSGIERYDTTLFSIHMVQHVLLTFVAPPFLLLGTPITVLLRVASPSLRRRVVLPVLHSAPIRFIAHPVVAWVAFTAVMWGTHFSPLFDLSLDDQGIHDLEHVLFVVSALLFWFPIVGADPAPSRLPYPGRLLYVLLQMPPSSFLAMAILFTNQPLYAHYQELGAPYGVTALADQQAAAGIMWLASDLILIVTLLFVVGAWMGHEERRTAEVEGRLDADRAKLAARADQLAAGQAALGSAGASRQAGSGEASRSR
jgi:putative membrane protein